MEKSNSEMLPAVTEETVPSAVKGVIAQQGFDIASMLPTAGKLKLTDEQKNILYAPPKEENVEIRPDGLIYLPWMEYATRLLDSFGLEWTLIEHGKPLVRDNFVMWKFHLVIQGHYCGTAVGEQEYQPTNKRMTYGDALEGAKSNALMRLCKGIGITLELWNPAFIKTWKAKYAETYIDREGKTKWRKKGTPEPEPEKTRTTAKTTGKTTKKKKTLGEIANKLFQALSDLYKGDKKKILKALKALSTFEKNDKVVFAKSFFDLSEKWAGVAYGNYKKWHEHMELEDTKCTINPLTCEPSEINDDDTFECCNKEICVPCPFKPDTKEVNNA